MFKKIITGVNLKSLAVLRKISILNAQLGPECASALGRNTVLEIYRNIYLAASKDYSISLTLLF